MNCTAEITCWGFSHSFLQIMNYESWCMQRWKQCEGMFPPHQTSDIGSAFCFVCTKLWWCFNSNWSSHVNQSVSEYYLIREGLWGNNVKKRGCTSADSSSQITWPVEISTVLWVGLHQQTIALVYVLRLEWKIMSLLCVTLMDMGR